MKKLSLCLSLSLLGLVTSGCVPNISPNQVQANNANQVTETVAGRIIAMQATVVTAADDNKVGMFAGAAAGGIAGSAIGGGDRMHLLGALGGAMIGGLAGNSLQNKLSTQQGMQYTVQLPTGRLLTVVQGLEGANAYTMGQCVILVEGSHARITGIADAKICDTIPLKRHHHAVAVQKVYIE